MAKIQPLADVGSLANTTAARAVVNENSQKIETAFQNTLSRDGSAPNQMEADIDLNDHYLLNVADPVNDADAVNLRSVRPLVEQFAADIVETAVFGTQVVDPFVASPGQFQFSLSEPPGNIENISVFVNGVARRPGTDFFISGPTLQTLSLATPLVGGETVSIRYAKALPSGITLSQAVTYTSPSTGAQTTVRDFLDGLWSPSAGSSLIRFKPVGGIDRTVQDKLREEVTITDYGALDNGIFDNAGAYAAAKANLVSGGVLRFPRLSTTGTYFISGVPDMTNVILEVDEGVQLSGTFSFGSNIRVRRNVKRVDSLLAYPYEFTPEHKKPWPERSIWLSDADKDNSIWSAIPTNTLVNLSNTYLSADTWPAAGGATANSDNMFWTSADTTQLFASMTTARGGDEISATFATGGSYVRAAVIRTTNGYHLVTAPGSGGQPSIRAKTFGNAATGNVFDYDGRSTYQSYYPENSMWSIRVYDRIRYSVLFNGQEVTGVQIANGDIIQVGFGWVPSATVTAVSITGWGRTSNIEPRGKRNIKVLIHGDSMSEDLHASWSYFMREALDMTHGIRVDNVINMAVGGQTSAQQLSSLTTNGVQGCQFTYICVGTNDIQGGVAVATTISNISAMIDYCVANGSTPIVWIPPLWYPNTFTGGSGMNTSGYQAGSDLRARLHRLAGTKSVKCVDMQQIMGPALATYRTDAATFGYDPVLRDNIHPTSYAYRVIGFYLAKALLGQYAPLTTRAKGSTFLNTSGVGTVLANGWTAALQQPRYSMDATGHVQLNGLIEPGTTTDGTVVLNLPVHLWPPTISRFICMSNSGTVRVTINTSGQMQVEGAAGIAWLALDNIHYLSVNS